MRKQFEEEQKKLSELWLKGGYGHIALPLILELCLLNAVSGEGSGEDGGTAEVELKGFLEEGFH